MLATERLHTEVARAGIAVVAVDGGVDASRARGARVIRAGIAVVAGQGRVRARPFVVAGVGGAGVAFVALGVLEALQGVLTPKLLGLNPEIPFLVRPLVDDEGRGNSDPVDPHADRSQRGGARIAVPRPLGHLGLRLDAPGTRLLFCQLCD